MMNSKSVAPEVDQGSPGFKLPHRPPLWQKSLLAIVSGVLSVVVFPKVGLSWLVWLCLVPLLISIHREPKGRQAFFLGFITGFVFFCGVCYWITSVLRAYGGLGWPGAITSFLFLAAYLSLFYAAFAWLFSKLSLCFPEFCHILSPFLWVATEFLRAHLLTGFPWCMVGYALVDHISLAQLATLTGIYGLSFVIVLFNSMVAFLFLKPRQATLYQLAMVSLALAGMTILFSWKTDSDSIANQEVRIVQTDISTEQEWDQRSKAVLLKELFNLSIPETDGRHSSQIEGFRIVLWPETPAPFYFNHDLEFRQQMQELARLSRRFLLFGFVDFSHSKDPSQQRDPYNSVALLSPQGNLVSQYNKVHLVPFGEYIPYPNIFFFVDKISTEAGNFKAGDQLVISPVGEGRKLGSFVCYEAIFPELVRRFVSGGAQVLVNVTNDGWFGDSPAPYQHLNMARFRAIENHRYLLRAANNGISAIIDPYGRIQKRTLLGERVVLDSVFEFEDQLTLYTRFGDVFAWICLGISLLLMGWLLERFCFRRGLSYQA